MMIFEEFQGSFATAVALRGGWLGGVRNMRLGMKRLGVRNKERRDYVLKR